MLVRPLLVRPLLGRPLLGHQVVERRQGPGLRREVSAHGLVDSEARRAGMDWPPGHSFLRMERLG